jgi:hypothetical protein
MAIEAQIRKVNEEAAAINEKYNDQTKVLKVIIESINPLLKQGS